MRNNWESRKAIERGETTKSEERNNREKYAKQERFEKQQSKVGITTDQGESSIWESEWSCRERRTGKIVIHDRRNRDRYEEPLREVSEATEQGIRNN
jgi:hypothetical protein